MYSFPYLPHKHMTPIYFNFQVTVAAAASSFVRLLRLYGELSAHFKHRAKFFFRQSNTTSENSFRITL